MSLRSEILEQPEILSHLFQTQKDHVNEMTKIILSRAKGYDTEAPRGLFKITRTW